MKRMALTAIFGGIVLAIAATNIVGIRSMLATAPDLSRVPLARLIVMAAGLEPKILAPAYRLDGALLAARLRERDGAYAMVIPDSPSTLLSHIDRFAVTRPGYVAIAGWAVPSDQQRRIAFIGVRAESRTLTLSIPKLVRPDVDAALGRPTGKPGFSFEIALQDVDACAVEIFALDDLLEISWLHKAEAGCLR